MSNYSSDYAMLGRLSKYYPFNAIIALSYSKIEISNIETLELRLDISAPTWVQNKAFHPFHWAAPNGLLSSR